MRLKHIVGTVMIAGLVGTAALRAADPTSKPAKPYHARTGKLVKPWSDITTLSDEQKAKIEAFHTKANEETHAIHEKEKAEILAVLTDDQKKELAAAEEKEAAERRAKAATTKPAEEKPEKTAAK